MKWKGTKILKRKHIIWNLITCILILTVFQGMSLNVMAKTISDTEPDGDLQPIQMFQIPEDEYAEEEITVYSGSEASDVYRDNWEEYGDDYCYHNLNTMQQALYDEMYAWCEMYMNSRLDAVQLTVSGSQVYGIGAIEYSGMTTTELSNLVFVFIYQNPQFYFLGNSVYYNSRIFYLDIYDAFSDGDVRSDVSADMYQKIDAWVSDIKQEGTQYQKEKKAHDIVCEQTVYQTDPYDQSAYSAVMRGRTVCAGYTKLYSILTNAAGLETVSVTSKSHGWNRTKIGDKWYNVDTTWDDGSTITYLYFNKSDSTMLSYDSSSSESHRQYSYYDLVAPACADDYNGESSVEVTAMAVSPASLVLDVDETESASVTVAFTPAEVSDKRVAYISGDTSIVTVDNSGVVTAVAPGKTTVTVRKQTNNLKAVCDISVYGTFETPSGLSIANRTSTSVTLRPISGCVYSKDAVNWQESATFSGLTPNTSYTFYAKRYASGYYRESGISAGLTTKTLAKEEILVPSVSVLYQTHVQTYGWENVFRVDGAVSGTSGQAKRLEAIRIGVTGNNKLGIQYTTHCQSYGWLPWSSNGEMNGTEGEAKRLEAIKIQLIGADKDKYDIYYRVHAQSYGWLGWAKNGAPAGTAGYAKRLEAIQIVVVKKGESINTRLGNITSARNEAYIALAGTSPVVGAAATNAQNPNIIGTSSPNVAYRTHVQTYGWQGWKYNGQMSGTSGQAKRLEGINIKLTNKQYSGGIAYTTHVQTYGWQGNVNNPSTWKKDGEMSGTSGQAKRLETICIKLTGEMEQHYDIYYRVHAQTYGWLDWAKNGAPAGTAGFAKRLEGIQIVLVPKGSAAPGNTSRPYISK